MDAAEKLFGLYGPEVLMVLGMYSLPMDFATRKDVHEGAELVAARRARELEEA
jgi:hypothetical protein